MKKSESWSLFRQSDRKQFDDLSASTVEFFYHALPEQFHGDWLVWKEGLEKWHPFSEALGYLKSRPKEPATPPPVIEENTQTHGTVSSRVLQAVATSSLRLKSTSGYTSPGLSEGEKTGSRKVLSLSDEETMSLMLESQLASDDRSNVRYSKKFKVRIFATQGILQTSTVDCSISGLRLSESLPEGLPKFFHLEIDLGLDGKIPLICTAIPGRDGKPGDRVHIQVNDHVQAYRSALMRAA